MDISIVIGMHLGTIDMSLMKICDNDFFWHPNVPIRRGNLKFFSSDLYINRIGSSHKPSMNNSKGILKLSCKTNVLSKVEICTFQRFEFPAKQFFSSATQFFSLNIDMTNFFAQYSLLAAWSNG